MSQYPWGEATATGIGSHPGEDHAEAVRVVFGELPALPYLPELPARGVGADMIGRTASLLVELPVEVQPSGWRFADRPGRDFKRARDHLAARPRRAGGVGPGIRGALQDPGVRAVDAGRGDRAAVRRQDARRPRGGARPGGIPRRGARRARRRRAPEGAGRLADRGPARRAGAARRPRRARCRPRRASGGWPPSSAPIAADAARRRCCPPARSRSCTAAPPRVPFERAAYGGRRGRSRWTPPCSGGVTRTRSARRSRRGRRSSSGSCPAWTPRLPDIDVVARPAVELWRRLGLPRRHPGRAGRAHPGLRSGRSLARLRQGGPGQCREAARVLERGSAGE